MNGRGCAAGWRRTPRDAACSTGCARPPARGRPTGAIRAASTAALAWPPRSTGRPSMATSWTPPSAPSWRRGRRASGRAQRRLRAGLAGVASLLVLAVIAGFVALDQRNQARARETAADAQRLGAQALASDDLDLALLLARQGVALTTPSQTRGNLLAALLKNPAAIGVIRGVGQPESLVAEPGRRRPRRRPLAGGFHSSTRARRRSRRRGAVRRHVAARRWVRSRGRAHRDGHDRTGGSRLRVRAGLVRLQARAARPYSPAFSVDERDIFIFHQWSRAARTEVRRFDA